MKKCIYTWWISLSELHSNLVSMKWSNFSILCFYYIQFWMNKKSAHRTLLVCGCISLTFWFYFSSSEEINEKEEKNIYFIVFSLSTTTTTISFPFSIFNFLIVISTHECEIDNLFTILLSSIFLSFFRY